MSTAEKLFEKARVLLEPTQAALLQLVESLAASPPPSPKPGGHARCRVLAPG